MAVIILMLLACVRLGHSKRFPCQRHGLQRIYVRALAQSCYYLVQGPCHAIVPGSMLVEPRTSYELGQVQKMLHEGREKAYIGVTYQSSSRRLILKSTGEAFTLYKLSTFFEQDRCIVMHTAGTREPEAYFGFEYVTNCNDKNVNSVCQKVRCQDFCASNPCMNGGRCTVPKSTRCNTQYKCDCLSNSSGQNCQYSATILQCPRKGGWLTIRAERNSSIRCSEVNPNDTIRWFVDDVAVFTCDLSRNTRPAACVPHEKRNAGIVSATRQGNNSVLTIFGRVSHTLLNKTVKCVSSSSGQYGCNIRVTKTARASPVDDVRPCSSNPCQNIATCVNKDGYYNCSCAVGFSGKNCEILVDYCANQPCLNYGTCIRHIGYFDCWCLDCFKGKTCQEEGDRQCTFSAKIPQCPKKRGYVTVTTELNNTIECSEVNPNDTIRWFVDEDMVAMCAKSRSTQRVDCAPHGQRNARVVSVSRQGLSSSLTIYGRMSHTLLNKTVKCVTNSSGQYGCNMRVIKKATIGSCSCTLNPADGTMTGHCVINQTMSVDTDLYKCLWFVRITRSEDGRIVQQSFNTSFQNAKLVGYFFDGSCVFSHPRNGDVTEGGHHYTLKFIPGPEQPADVCTEPNVYIDDCLSNPCLFGGTCHDLLNDFTCNCREGYRGKLCHEDSVDQCASAPCQNGGFCTDLTGYYRCECPTGASGENCETDADECVSQPCLNNGSCIDHVGHFTCQCLGGFKGKICDRDLVDQCSPNPCQHGGSCAETLDQYTCTCPMLFTGEHCEKEVFPCDSDPCRNGGSCIEEKGGYRCVCWRGYQGSQCELGGKKQSKNKTRPAMAIGWTVGLFLLATVLTACSTYDRPDNQSESSEMMDVSASPVNDTVGDRLPDPDSCHQNDKDSTSRDSTSEDDSIESNEDKSDDYLSRTSSGSSGISDGEEDFRVTDTAEDG